MDSPNPTPTHPTNQSISDLNTTSLTSWSNNTSYWDDYMGSSGNEFYQVLEMPALERLVDLQNGEHVLDLATGNGLVARRMRELNGEVSEGGGVVVGTDGCEEMLERARVREGGKEGEGEKEVGVEWRLLDVTKEGDLEREIERAREHDGFHAITMNMAIMDVPTLEPMAKALPQLLRENGRFVATILHPAFMTSTSSRVMSLAENRTTGRFETKHSINVSGYLDVPPAKTEALHGQPTVQMLFHRPLQDLFRPFFKHGLVLDGLEEPSFTSGPDTKKIQSFYNFPQIPPVMVFRMRKVGK